MTQTQLDPQVRSLLEAMKAAGLPPVFTLPVADARRARRRQLVVDPPRVEMAKIEDDLVPGPLGGIPLRWYRPSLEGGLPVTLFFHGGGWTVDDLDTHDHLCRRLAGRSRSVVVSVAYRRGPEHPYPAAVDDAYAAAGWVAAVGRERGIDPTRLAVAGDSAGGNLAIVVALLCRDRRGPTVRFQALAYPVTDYWQAGRASYARYAEGYTLSREFMRWAFQHYLPDGFDRTDPYVFPLRAADLSGLPPALIVTAEFDPLRDEGQAYAERLRAAGVRVEHVHFGGPAARRPIAGGDRRPRSPSGRPLRRCDPPRAGMRASAAPRPASATTDRRSFAMARLRRLKGYPAGTPKRKLASLHLGTVPAATASSP